MDHETTNPNNTNRGMQGIFVYLFAFVTKIYLQIDRQIGFNGRRETVFFLPRVDRSVLFNARARG